MQQFHIRLSDGSQFGPATVEVLCQWAKEGRVPIDATLVPVGGGDAVPVLSVPELRALLHAPPTVPGPVQAHDTGGDATGGLIPYKNPHALIGYYVSIGSLIPFIGAVAGPVAIGLGISGLRKRAANPAIRGAAHGWVAIIVGALGFLISSGCITSMVISMAGR